MLFTATYSSTYLYLPQSQSELLRLHPLPSLKV